MLPHFPTVAEAIARIGEFYPENTFTFQDLKGVEKSYSFVTLEKTTAARAGAIQALGLEKGDRVGLIVVEPEEFVLTFLSCLRIGVVPVPLYPPVSFANLDAYVERTGKVLDSSGARMVFCSTMIEPILAALPQSIPTLESMMPVESLGEGTPLTEFPDIEPDDLAFLQYTSGSTADPKGVMVTHSCLIANADAIMNHGAKLHPERDVTVSWLPLYHDMGLIGFVISPICHGISSVFIPTMRFIKRPSVWMETMHQHRATTSFAPNFAYALAARRVRESDLNSWDLSCIRILGCGAEPINPQVMRNFTELFHTHCGLPNSAVLPAYGMAEATLAISFKPVGSSLKTLSVSADDFENRGVVTESQEGDVLEHVSCGPVFPKHEIAVFDDDGNRLPQGHQGELCLRGPSVTPGYFNNEEATKASFRNGWLHTGDLGYVWKDEVYVTGRLKDLIIINGRNIHPQSIEWVASEVEGVRRGNVVAFSRPGPTSEEIVLVVETRLRESDELSAEIRRVVKSELSVMIADVMCIKPGNLPKTSSGKLQRRKLSTLYQAGGLENQRIPAVLPNPAISQGADTSSVRGTP